MSNLYNFCQFKREISSLWQTRLTRAGGREKYWMGVVALVCFQPTIPSKLYIHIHLHAYNSLFPIRVIVASTTSSPRKPIPLRPTLQSTYSSPVLGSNEDRARLASLPSSQPHSRKPSSSFSAANTTSVRNCIDCGCDEFAENHFKPGVCRTCFHKLSCFSTCFHSVGLLTWICFCFFRGFLV